MGASLLVSEQEYLTTSYEPECEFDNGKLLARNTGELPHSLLMTAVACFLHERARQHRIQVLPILRIRIGSGRYRVPDVCVYKQPAPRDPIPNRPPFIAIEILSPEDRMSRVRTKIDEYLAFGVPYVWLIDPQRRRADVYTASGFYEAKDGVLRTEDPAIEVPLAELFQALDD
ncbi:MAG: Uma2 family endonuclease [Bryobacteraceae bacterium]|jgi:Uma2 family endonuclease